MPPFIPGLQLAERFYNEAIAPILAREYPGVPYSAGLMGPGSDVLGFDTARSTDHEWGPRALIFLAEDDFLRYAAAVSETLRHTLPPQLAGYSTHFGPSDEERIRVATPWVSGPVEHKVLITTVARFLQERLGIASSETLDVVDWLLCPQQRLLEITAGAVFHDGLGDLGRARAALAYYPRAVWLYLLASQWSRIAEQDAFVGRCGEVGDEAGSALVAAALARDLMHLAFLMERRYAPYSKWLGTAFARLPCAARLGPPLAAALAARSWSVRESALSAAYEIAAGMHNALALTEPLPARVSRFHERPFLVIHGWRFADALRDQISDGRVRRLPPGVGGIDQFVDSTPVLEEYHLRRALAAVYASGSGNQPERPTISDEMPRAPR
jgi:hypothetical protein